MKVVILICLLFLSTFCAHHGLKVTVGTRFSVSPSSDFELHCSGAEGDVSYEVHGLPQGMEVKNNKIHASQGVQVGDYVIKIVATDSSSQTATKIVGMNVKESEQSAQEQIVQEVEQSQTGRGSRLVNIINTYSTVTRVSKKKYENNRYPETDFPTGASQKLVSTVNEEDAETSEENRNEITAEDVALRAASERHQNAVKAITNIISIIDQARANSLYAKRSVEKYIREYNAALVAQRNVQNQIVKLETEVVQIRSALEGVTEFIAQLNGNLQDLENQKAGSEEEKNKIIAEISVAEKKKAELLAEIEKINSRLAELIKQLGINKEKCQDIRGQLDAKRAEKKKVQDTFANIQKLKDDAKNNIKEKTGIVEDLRKKLMKAESDLSDAKIQLSDLEEQQKGLPEKIAGLEKQIADLSARLAACEAETQRIQAEIDGTSSDDLVQRADDLENQILDFRKRVIELDGSIAGTLKPIEELKAKIGSIEGDLAYLKEEIILAEERLNACYILGNDANDAVAKARANVDASNTRYEKQTKIVSQATLNLERARAEEALARLAVDELIAKYTSALPYAIVPHGDGSGAGTPHGNNPSGSALGPIKTNGDGAPGSFKVTSWDHYLSQAFGSGVHPSFIGSVTELYPFNFHSEVDGHMVTNKAHLRGQSEDCGGVEGDVVGSGEVISVGQNSFKVRLDNNGGVYEIHVNSCTKANANKNGYEMKSGDEAVFKGHIDNGKIMAEKMTCLA